MKDDIPMGYARVTELLSPYSALENIDPAVLKKAADRGTRVHNYCELYAESALIIDVELDCVPYVESFKTWFDSYVDTVINLEERLFDPFYMITGKYDMLVTLKGSSEILLVDLKTPMVANPVWSIQTAAYAYLLHIYNRRPSRRGCLMLKKDGKPAVFKEYTNDEDEKIFLNLVKVYRYFNK